MRMIIGLLTIFWAIEVGAAAPPGEPPAPVTQHLAKATAGGDLWLQSVIWRPVFESVAAEETYIVDVPVFVNGKKTMVKETRKRVVTRTENKFVSESVVGRVKISDIRFFDLTGKPLDAAATTARLRSESRVLVATGELPAADVLQIFQPGTLVLVLPPTGKTMAILSPDAGPPNQADEPPDFSAPPARISPRFTFASTTSDGRLKLTNRWQEKFESTVTRTVEKPDGTDQQVPEVIRGTDTQTRVRELSAEVANFYDTDGKPVPAPKAAERLKQETLLVESSDSALPDPFYLRFIKKGVLIMTIPGEARQNANAAPPAAVGPAPAAAPGPKTGR